MDKCQVYGSNKQKPIKTNSLGNLEVTGNVNVDNVVNPVTVNPVDVTGIANPVTVTGTVDIGNTVNVNIAYSSLVEAGKLFAWSCRDFQTFNVFEILNPINSGKTLKIHEIWITTKWGDALVKLIKNSHPIYENGFVSLSGGQNLNFSFDNEHVAEFYKLTTGPWYGDDNTFFEIDTQSGKTQKIIFNGNIVIPSNPSQPQHLKVLVDMYWEPDPHMTVSVTIIWSEE